MKKLLLAFFVVLLALVVFARSCNISIDPDSFVTFWNDIIGQAIETIRKITDTVGGILDGIFGGTTNVS